MLSPGDRVSNIFEADATHYLSHPPDLSAPSEQIGVGTSFIGAVQNNMNVVIVFSLLSHKVKETDKRNEKMFHKRE